MDAPGVEDRDAPGGLGQAEAMQAPLPARAVVSPRSKQVGTDPSAPGLALLLIREGLPSLLFGPLLSISAVATPDWEGVQVLPSQTHHSSSSSRL